MLDPQGLPLQLLVRRPRRRRPGARRDRDARREAAEGARLAGRGRPGAAAAARLRHRGERRPTCAASPTGSTAATRTTASGRRSWSASAACAPSARTARSPGTRSPRCSTPTRATPGFLGLERIRELSREPGPHVRRGAGDRARGHGVHHAHAGARRASTASRSTWSRHYFHADLLPGVPTDRVLALGARGQPEHVQHGAHGPAPGPARQRRVASCTARCQPRHVRRPLWPGFDADEVPIGSVTNGVHGRPGWRARSRAAPRRAAGRSSRGRGWSDRARSRDASCGAARRAARAAGRRGAPPGAGGVAAARRLDGRAGLDRARVRPGRAHRRLRPPRADLQAAHADAARPGPAARAAAGPAAAGAARRRRQVATRPTTAARR